MAPPRAIGFASDERGLAYAILLVGATVIAGSLFYIAMEPAFSDIMTQHAANTDTQQAETGAKWIKQAWTWAPLAVMALVSVLIIARAVVESRGP